MELYRSTGKFINCSMCICQYVSMARYQILIIHTVRVCFCNVQTVFGIFHTFKAVLIKHFSPDGQEEILSLSKGECIFFYSIFIFYVIPET